jgi:uncharacterized protein YlbG (UPF0298 family)
LVNKIKAVYLYQQKQTIMKTFNKITKEELIKTVQNNMKDAKGTNEYLQSLTKDELRTLLCQLVVLG